MITKLCGYPGCNKLTGNDCYYCPEHRTLSDKLKKENAFKSAVRYGDYNSHEWRKLRYEVMKEHPYCERCGIDKFNAELHVHHIVPVKDNPERFLDKTNLVVLCEHCHAMETQREINNRRDR